MTDEKVTADEIIAAMRVADVKKKSGKGGSASIPTPSVDSPLPVSDVTGETGGPVSGGTDAMGVVDEGREACPDCGDSGIVPAVGLGYSGDAEPDMEPCRHPVHDDTHETSSWESLAYALKRALARIEARSAGKPGLERIFALAVEAQALPTPVCNPSSPGDA